MCKTMQNPGVLLLSVNADISLSSQLHNHANPRACLVSFGPAGGHMGDEVMRVLVCSQKVRHLVGLFRTLPDLAQQGSKKVLMEVEEAAGSCLHVHKPINTTLAYVVKRSFSSLTVVLNIDHMFSSCMCM